MTASQKQQIMDMQRRGLSYAEIADAVGLLKNTVKTFCWRNRIPQCNASGAGGITENKAENQCKHCGKPLEQRPKQKPRQYCNDYCRLAWWKVNRDSLNRKAVYHFNCLQCGADFESYGDKGRKYCCHECYINARFGSGAGRTTVKLIQ